MSALISVASNAKHDFVIQKVQDGSEQDACITNRITMQFP